MILKLHSTILVSNILIMFLGNYPILEDVLILQRMSLSLATLASFVFILTNSSKISRKSLWIHPFSLSFPAALNSRKYIYTQVGGHGGGEAYLTIQLALDRLTQLFTSRQSSASSAAKWCLLKVWCTPSLHNSPPPVIKHLDIQNFPFPEHKKHQNYFLLAQICMCSKLLNYSDPDPEVQTRQHLAKLGRGSQAERWFSRCLCNPWFQTGCSASC